MGNELHDKFACRRLVNLQNTITVQRLYITFIIWQTFLSHRQKVNSVQARNVKIWQKNTTPCMPN